MSSKNDKYRNPPLPLGYVKKDPQLVLKKKNDDGIDIDELIDLVILSGICDVPDASVYDHFTINSCSEDDDITEVPVEICPKNIEVLHIEDDEDVSKDSKEDIKVVIKKEVDSPELQSTTEISEDVEQGSKASTSSKHTTNLIKTDLCSVKSDKTAEDKKPKKHDRGHKSSYHSKKINERKDSCSNHDSDSSSYSKKKRIKKDYEKDSESYSRSRHKRESYESGSESHRSRHERRKSYDSDSDSHSKHKRDYTDKESCKRKELPKRYIKGDYDSDDSSHRIKSKNEYSSDDSESASVRTGRRRHDYSPTEYERTVTNIKQEHLLFGQYNCDVCNLTLNSFSTYQSHINGKRHMKAKNAQTAAVRPLAVIEEGSRCPKPPPGYIRKKMDGPAHIQPVLNQSLRNPCPGLEFVTEIHTVGETVYYCSFCNSPCGSSSILPHLSGFKHQINSLKHYNKDLYEEWNYLPKYTVEARLMHELRAIQDEFGRGQVQVEKDFRVKDGDTDEFAAASRAKTSKPSTSAQAAEKAYTGNFINYSEPDPSKPGFYCKLCDSHSNSEGMWQNHILGKRHLANLKKAPGSVPSKSKYIPAASNVRPYLFDLLDKSNHGGAPVVGLGQIREIRKPDIDGVSYNCFLCNACISSFEIVDHILSRKHREKYLDSVKHPELETLKSCHMSDMYRESIITDICINWEKEHGSGVPEVYYAKNAVRRG